MAGLAAITSAGSVAAKPATDQARLDGYTQARLAEFGGAPERAAALYLAQLDGDDDPQLIAGKAFDAAILAGDPAMIDESLSAVQKAGVRKPQLALLNYALALADRDWKKAAAFADAVEDVDVLTFMAPMLKDWLAVARGKRPPQRPADPQIPYAADHQLLIGLFQENDAPEELSPLVADVTRVVASQHLLATGKPGKVRTLLGGARTGAADKLRRDLLAGREGAAHRIRAPEAAGFLLFRLADDLTAGGNARAALEVARGASRLFSDGDYGKEVLGDALLAMEEPERARALYAAIDLDGPHGYNGVAKYVDANGEDALAAVEKAIAERPRSPQLFFMKGQILQRADRRTEAAAALGVAVALATEQDYDEGVLSNFWLAYGGAQERAGQWPDGLRSLERANALAPGSPTILNYLGYAQLERRENVEEALALVRQAHDARPSSAAITDSLGWGYYLIGKVDEAVPLLERALAGEPSDPTINEHLGDAYWSSGRLYEARYAWRAAKLTAEDADQPRLDGKIADGLAGDASP